MFRKQRVLIAAVLVVLGISVATRAAEEVPLMKESDPAKLVSVLKSDAAEFDKAKACQRLALVGGKEAIAALAELLADPKLAHYARFGLEPNADPAVDRALRDAMPKLQGKLLVGVIDSIGFRRDSQATEALVKLATGSDAEVAAAALAALGRIATPQAVQTLQQALRTSASSVAADASLACAERLAAQGQTAEAVALLEAVRKAGVPKHCKLAAVRLAILLPQDAGLPLLVEQLSAADDDFFAAAIGAARVLKAKGAVPALSAALANLPAPRKAMVLRALGDRSDAKLALPTAIRAAKSGEPEVRMAAIRVLAKLGDPSAVPVLLEAASEANADLAAVALTGLAALPGKEVDDALVAKLVDPAPAVRQAAIQLVGQRRIAAALSTLLQAADDADPKTRVAALRALGQVIELKDLNVLLGRALTPKTPEEAPVAQEALKAACMRAADREACASQLAAALPKAGTEGKVFLFELLGTVGGAKSLETLAAAAKQSDPALQDVATRVLGEWMSADAGPVLLELAKSSLNEKYRVRALRGHIRIARQLAMSPQQRVAMSRDALAAAWRNEDRQLVYQVLARNPSPEALALVVAQLDVKEQKRGAIGPAITIAEKIADSQPAAVAGAMKKLLQAGAAGEQGERAKALLEQVEKKAK